MHCICSSRKEIEKQNAYGLYHFQQFDKHRIVLRVKGGKGTLKKTLKINMLQAVSAISAKLSQAKLS